MLTGLAVVVLAAADGGWSVPLVGGSTRWAAGAVLLLGMAACALGSPAAGVGSSLLAGLGTVALVLIAVTLVTGSLTALSLAVAAFVALWLGSALRHLLAGRSRPSATA